MKRLLAATLMMLVTCPLLAQPPYLADERNTINIYQKTASNVVFVHRYQRVMNRSWQVFEIPAGAGSGFIWDQQGHVVTNFHVVRGSHELAVQIGATTAPAKLIGQEPRKDIAVLKIEQPSTLKKIKAFKPLVIADSRQLLVGQKVIAIGNPFGLDHSLSTGVVSALGRDMPGEFATLHDMIQTDAAINPGNSGGPLLDSQGRLIGMNTAILSPSGSSAGIGFAVPAEDISRIVNQIIQHGRVVLAGIGIQRVEPSIAGQLGVDEGILIGQIIANTPAADAKLQGTYRDSLGRLHVGDVIVAINGHPTPTYDELYHLMSTLKVGEIVNLTIRRQQQRLQIKLRTIDIAAQS